MSSHNGIILSTGSPTGTSSAARSACHRPIPPSIVYGGWTWNAPKPWRPSAPSSTSFDEAFLVGRRMRTMRRIAALLVSSLLAATAAVGPAQAESRHGLSAFGELKYPADFK